MGQFLYSCWEYKSGQADPSFPSWILPSTASVYRGCIPIGVKTAVGWWDSVANYRTYTTCEGNHPCSILIKWIMSARWPSRARSDFSRDSGNPCCESLTFHSFFPKHIRGQILRFVTSCKVYSFIQLLYKPQSFISISISLWIKKVGIFKSSCGVTQ